MKMSSRRPVQLYNSSPETVHWVVTLLDDAVGSENLTDLKPENLVQISPSSGTLKPYSAQKVEISILADKNLPTSSQLIIYSQFSLISRYTFLKIESRLSQDWVKIESRLSQDWVKIESKILKGSK